MQIDWFASHVLPAAFALLPTRAVVGQDLGAGDQLKLRQSARRAANLAPVFERALLQADRRHQRPRLRRIHARRQARGETCAPSLRIDQPPSVRLLCNRSGGIG